MSEALLSALRAAKSEKARAWVFLQASLDVLDEPERAAVFAAAIPHRVDADLLAELLNVGVPDAENLLARLAERSHIEADRRGGFTVPADSRELLLDRISRDNPSRFQRLNAISAARFASRERGDPRAYAEFVYHGCIAHPWIDRPHGVLDLVRSTVDDWNHGPDFLSGCIEAILPLVGEQAAAGRLGHAHAPDRMELWRAVMYRSDGRHVVALALEGGGALCAYHAGVYQALHDAGTEPDWITCESMGAMVGAIIAGNPPERRVERLQEAWARFAQAPLFSPASVGPMSQWQTLMSQWQTLVFGLPGLFTPSLIRPMFGESAFYDLAPMRETLLRLVDFDRLNSGAMRYATSAVNAETGNLTVFDNAYMQIKPEHVIASIAPDFPMVRFGGTTYWDGSLAGHTALQHVLSGVGDLRVVVFQPYLFAIAQRLPRTPAEVDAQQRGIRYTNRARLVNDYYRKLQVMRNALQHALQRLPDDLRTPDENALLANLASEPHVSIVNLVYRRATDETVSVENDFASDAIQIHWKSGYTDTARALGLGALNQGSGGGIVIREFGSDSYDEKGHA